jgi:hypothetical protein
LTAGTFDNGPGGTVTVPTAPGGNAFTTGSSATFLNEAGATIDLQGAFYATNSSAYTFGSGGGLLSNAGTLLRDTYRGTFTVGVAYTGNGTVSVTSGYGNLTFAQGGTFSGPITNNSFGISTITFDGTADYTFASGADLGVYGPFAFQDGTFNIATDLSINQLSLTGTSPTLTVSAGKTLTLHNTDWSGGGTIAGPGTVQVATLTIDGTANRNVTGTLSTVSGGSLLLDTSAVVDLGATGQIVNQGDLEFGSYGGTSPTLTGSGGTDQVVNQGILSAQNGHAPVLAARLSNTGEVRVGNGTTLTVSAPVAQFATSTLSAGTWKVLSGTLALTDPGAANITTIGSAASVTLGGTFSKLGTLADNQGTLTLFSDFDAAGPFTNSGNIQLSALGSPTTLYVPGVYTQTGGSTNLGYSFAAGTLYAGGGISLAGGTLGGSGTVQGNMFNTGGTVAPGDPVVTNIQGNYTQGSGGTLAIEAQGTDPNVPDFDQLVVTGSANLAGTLTVTLLNGFIPSRTDSLAFLTAAGGISGDFATKTLPNYTAVNKSPLEPATPTTYSLSGTAFVVTSDTDDGAGSLRQAILGANAAAGADDIVFNTGGGPVTIRPLTPLPQITDVTVIDGTTQLGYAGSPLVELDGSQVFDSLGAADGLDVMADSSTVRGIIINRFTGVGVRLAGTADVLEGNWIGLASDGATAAPNDTGVEVDNLFARIGTNADGTNDAAEGNVISGNTQYGIRISGGNDTAIAGNDIGTDSSGQSSVPNADGIAVFGGTGAVVGTDGLHGVNDSAQRNIISGNTGRGVVLDGANTVAGNWIGLDVNGNELGNGYGIQITGSGSVVGTNDDGSGDADERNVISGNAFDGIIMSSTGATVAGNYIGTDPTGTVALPNLGSGVHVNSGGTLNTIGGMTDAERNLISGNAAAGVELSDVGTTDNIVVGNWIGLDATGTGILGNLDGVAIHDRAASNHVGGGQAGAGNVISGNVDVGVALDGTDHDDGGNRVQGNFIGTDPTGTIVLGNFSGGVRVYRNDLRNYIGTDGDGTDDATEGNVISGSDNDTGVEVNASAGTVIAGNRIGTSADGLTAMPNGTGVVVRYGSTGTQIGGPDAVERNLISGNAVNGVDVQNADSTQIQGNWIGVNSSGLAPLGNVGGVQVEQQATNTLIGGLTPIPGTEAGNVISGNESTRWNVMLNGPATVQGNVIGLAADGATLLAGTPGAGIGSSGVSGSNSLIGGTDVQARNVISGNSLGLDLNGVSGWQILNNYVGLDVTGSQDVSNGGNNLTDVSGLTFGAPRAGNVVVGVSGVPLVTGSGDDWTVQGNRFGTTADGSAVLGSLGEGLRLSDGTNATIGGTGPGEGNQFAGGVTLENRLSVTVLHNTFGLNSAGTVMLTGPDFGVNVAESSGVRIGDGTEAGRNVFALVGQVGVLASGAATTNLIVAGNWFGTDVTGADPLGSIDDPVEITDGVTGADVYRNVIATGNDAGVRIDGGGIPDGTVAWFRGNDTYDNAIPNLAGGTPTGPVYFDSGLNGTDAFHFSHFGDISYVSAEDPGYIQSAAGLTVQAWVNPNSVPDNGQLYSIVSDGDISNPNYFLGYTHDTDSGHSFLVFGYHTTTGLVTVAKIIPDLTDGIFHHVAVTSDGTTIRFYLDGSEFDNEQVTGTPTGQDFGPGDPTRTLYIGGLPTAGNGFDGRLEDVAVGSTPLSAVQIAGIAAAGGDSLGGTGTGGNTVEGNLIGLLPDGFTAGVVGGDGIAVADSATNTVRGNTIADVGGSGVAIIGSVSGRNLVVGNTLGLDENGNPAGNSFGITLGQNSHETTVGGIYQTDRNIISANYVYGVYVLESSSNVIEGNYIGTDPTGGQTGFGNQAGGVQIEGHATNNSVGGGGAMANVISGNGGAGVSLSNGPTYNYISGNFIGTDPTGSFVVENQGPGVSIKTADFNTIGGYRPAGYGNLISGNTDGVYLLNASGNNVYGNWIGLASDGSTPLPNSANGVVIDPTMFVSSRYNQIGSSATGYGNVISGNAGNGVDIDGTGATDNTVAGNLIGLDATGTFAVGNAGAGILVEDGASFNTVGTTVSGGGNVISGNAYYGIVVVDWTGSNPTVGNVIQNNRIGTTADGLSAAGNASGGVYLAEGAVNTYVGSAADTSGRNLISGNGGDGVTVNAGVPVPDGLVARYQAEGSARDSAGTNNGTLMNGAKLSDRGVAPGTGDPPSIFNNFTWGPAADAPDGQAFQLDGVDDYVSIPDAAALHLEQFTVGGWFNFDSLPGGVETLFSKTYGDGNDQSFALWYDQNGNFRFHISNGSVAATGLIPFAVVPGLWYHVALSFDASSGYTALSVNGTAIDAEFFGPLTVAYDDHPMLVGAQTVAGFLFSPFGGRVDDVTVFDSAYVDLTDIVAGRTLGANYITANDIGVDATGNAALANVANGVQVSGGSGVVIGGARADGASRNVIAGNSSDQVEIAGSSGVIVAGNRIGTTADGTAAVPTAATNFTNSGVQLGDGSFDNVIGGTVPSAGNLISGNRTAGVTLFCLGTTDNAVIGNTIGLSRGGVALPNQIGVWMPSGVVGPATGNVIGGSGPGEGNVISGNASDGVDVDGGLNGMADHAWYGDGSGVDDGAVGGSDANLSNGATYGPGRIDQGFQLGGSPTAAVDFGEFTPGLNDFSLAFWVRTTDADRVLFTTRSDTSIEQYFRVLILPDGQIAAEIRDDSTSQSSFVAGPIVTDGAYHQVTVARGFGGDLLVLYVDGQTGDGEQASGAAIDLSAGNLIAGSAPGSGDPSPVATIDEVQTFSVAIDDAQARGLATVGNTIQGNFIGTSADGMSAVPNAEAGIFIRNGARAVQIGGGAAGSGNVISGNGLYGIYMEGVGHHVQGNVIGLASDGATPLGNDIGVRIDLTTDVVIGTDADGFEDDGERNVIGANSSYGLDVTRSDNLRVSGNYLGVAADGFSAAGNGIGIHFNMGTSDSLIGGPTAVERNVIDNNPSGGVILSAMVHDVQVEGNYIGVAADGTTPAGNGTGVLIELGAHDNVIGGTVALGNVVCGNTGDGVVVTGSGTAFNTIAGNFIGLGADGVTGLGNGGEGVELDSGTYGNTIGGDSDADGNIISGNSYDGIGLFTGATGNTIRFNRIGTTADGTAGLGNDGNGVTVNNSDHNTLRDNLISGNGFEGVGIFGTDSFGNVVAGNFIGTDVTGLLPIGNDDAGLDIGNGAHDNTIGGTTAADRNVIGGNNGDGIDIDGTLDGTVSRYAADGDTTDSVGPNGGSAVGNLTYAAGKSGQAFQFDGAGSGVSIPDSASLQFTNGFTLEAWVNPTDLSNDPIVMSKFGLSGDFHYELELTANGGLRANVSGDGTTYDVLISGGGLIVPGMWAHVATTFDNGDWTLYVNGIAVAHKTSSVTSVYTGGSQPLLIGRDVTTRHYYEGLIDNVGLYNRALDQSEVQAVYAANGSALGGNAVRGNYIGTDVTGSVAMGNGGGGIEIVDSAANTVGGSTATDRNVISGNGGGGVSVNGVGAENNIVAGNYIGTTADGSVALSNGGAGVGIGHGASFNVIGGTTAGARNVVSGNHDGVTIDSPRHGPVAVGNTVEGNFIGTDATGTFAISNGTGVLIAGASENVIGGPTAGAGNLISGNDREGILILTDDRDTIATANVIQGNYIGTDVTGLSSLPNGTGIYLYDGALQTQILDNLISGNVDDAVYIGDSDSVIRGNLIGTDATGRSPLPNDLGVEIDGAGGTVVGGTTAADRNVISGNVHEGVRIDGGASGNVVEGNFIGVGGDGTTPLGNGTGVAVVNSVGNTIGGSAPGAGNVISGNAGDGVNVSGTAPTPGLTAQYQADGTADDSAGSNNGTTVNVSYAPGISGTPGDRAFLFNGNGQVNLPDDFAYFPGGISYSVDAWIETTQSVGDQAVASLFEGAYGSSGLSRFEVWVHDGHLEGIISDSDGNSQTLAGTANVADGQYHHVAVVRDTDDDLFQLYVDGTLDAQDTLVATNIIGFEGSSTETIGWHRPATQNGTDTDSFTGRIDDVGFWRAALGAGDVQAIYLAHGVLAPTTIIQGNDIGVDSSGTTAVPNDTGVRLVAGATRVHVAGNIISGNNNGGILISDGGTTGNVVEGNFIGTNAAGTAAVGNGTFGDGVKVQNGATGNIIGGTASGAGNVIGGNFYGIEVTGTGTDNNAILGNRVGTNAAGTATVNNFDGIIIGAVSGTRIGDGTAAGRNLISGNVVAIDVGGATNTQILGNWIGVDVTGTASLYNVSAVRVEGGSTGTLVGGPGAGNLISGNASGVELYGSATTGNTVAGNLIGTNAAGTGAVANGTGVTIGAGATNNIVGGTTAGARNVISGNSIGVNITDLGTAGNAVTPM